MQHAPKEKTNWFLTPAFVIAMLFFVIGPFALPLLYKSPAFSKTAKIVLTCLVIAMSLLVLLTMIKLFKDYFNMIDEIQNMLHQ